MSRTADEERAREEARFNRAQQRARQDEALKAQMAAEGQAVDKKTERLRALRLARDATDAAAKPGHTRKDKGKPLPPLVADPDEVKGG